MHTYLIIAIYAAEDCSHPAEDRWRGPIIHADSPEDAIEMAEEMWDGHPEQLIYNDPDRFEAELLED